MNFNCNLFFCIIYFTAFVLIANKVIKCKIKIKINKSDIKKKQIFVFKTKCFIQSLNTIYLKEGMSCWSRLLSTVPSYLEDV